MGVECVNGRPVYELLSPLLEETFGVFSGGALRVHTRVCVCVCVGLTQEVGQQLGLVVVHGGHTHGVEAHQAQHGPVEGLSLHYLADEEAQPSLLLAVVGAFDPVLQAGAGETCRGGGQRPRGSFYSRVSAVTLSKGLKLSFVSILTALGLRFLTYCVPHVVLSFFGVQQLRLVVFGFDGWPSPRT